MSSLDWDESSYMDHQMPPMRIDKSHPFYTPNDSSRGHRNNNYSSPYERRSNGQYDDQSRGHRGHKDDYSRRSSDASKYSESLDISEDMVGRVIGRSGSNITRIQNEFEVRIQVFKTELKVEISGNSKNNVADAMHHLRKQLHDNGNRGRSDRDYNRSGGGQRNNNYEFRAPEPPAEIPLSGDLTGTIDWAALNKASEAAQAARWAKCPPLTKDFYKESAEVANLPAEQVQRMRQESNNITVSHVFEAKEGDTLPPIPNPVWRFEQCFEQYPDLLDEIKKQGFEKPSPIQSQAWPILLKGHDMIGIAQTGTGKTLAFLLPGMIHTEYQSTPRGTRGGANVLVLAPTRELALQIEMEVKKYSFRDMRAVCVYGGGSRQMQISDVERGAEIIICTPGRLNDLVQAGVIKVSTITYLVLDEADRMLDMGFEPQIRKVLLDIRPDRQTIMTSATWPPGVRRLAQSYMRNPIQVCVGSLDLAATHSVQQVIELLEDDQDKFQTLKAFVKNMKNDDKIIVFCGRKARADDLSSDLSLGGFNTQCIHGNREQSDREQAIADIKSGMVRILVATDVASRGLDIEDITHVINYDFPRNIEEYVHRVGRTGRAGRKGTSISFITREDWGMTKELIAILEEANQEVPEKLRDMAQRFSAMKERRAAEGGGGGRGFRDGGRGSGGGGRRDRY
ncbi:probable ATP-dependent RNA helicase DDX43 [Drosophila nasuta]|uniref:probable ATP-dependent RNA helicase DDX43 n=1 Tax=Drosophila nasuta TaxID=42062 RepID=UPI00295F1642|nr:probable ATP-dependent RNA helicase DDX43 [Drosophila nasuta]